jgi:hypothetical protein
MDEKTVPQFPTFEMIRAAVETDLCGAEQAEEIWLAMWQAFFNSKD